MALDFHNLANNADVLRQVVMELATQMEANEPRLERIKNILEPLLSWRFGEEVSEGLEYVRRRGEDGAQAAGAVLVLPPHYRPEQPPRQVPFRQWQPEVPGMLDQPPTRLD